MRSDRLVAMAAHGEHDPGSIGTEVADSRGGYEARPSSSLVAPSVERVLTDAIRRLLRDRGENSGPCRERGPSVMIRVKVPEGGGRDGTGPSPGRLRGESLPWRPLVPPRGVPACSCRSAFAAPPRGPTRRT